MQKVVSIFFLLVFVMVTFQDLTFYSLFKLNQDFLTEKFCVNKEKKEMKCKASCHFKKQVKKAKKAQEKSPQVTERFEVNLFVSNFYFDTISVIDYLKHSDYYKENILEQYQFNFLRPPQAA